MADLAKMQARAIIEAAADVAKKKFARLAAAKAAPAKKAAKKK
jgi:hypothetical protein